MTDDKRSTKRFPLQLPITVKYSNGKVRHGEGEARNLSVGGIYFYTATELRVGDQIELALPLPSELRGDRQTWVLCRGRVVRVESTSTGEVGVGAVVEHYDVIANA
jgi:PilZ domain